jgi:transposase-like protein
VQIKVTRHAYLLERAFVEVRRRTTVIGRFPGETEALLLTWAVIQAHAGAGPS